LTDDEAAELKRFLRDNVSSFEELETLLYLAAAERQAWSCADIAAAAGIPEELAEAALTKLSPTFVAREERNLTLFYRYVPPVDREPPITRLRRAYDAERLAVVQMMTSNAIERVRSAAARRLADAFRVRGDKS